MEIVHYFEKYNNSPGKYQNILSDDFLGASVSFFNGKEDWFRNFNYDVVIIGVPESRNGVDNIDCLSAPDKIRSWLYSLRSFGSTLKIADLGNIRGSNLNDRYQALREVTNYICNQNTVIIILGGSQDLTFPIYQGMINEKQAEQAPNIAIADAMADIDIYSEDFSSRSWLSYLINSGGPIPEELVLFGVQKYLMTHAQEKFLKDKFYDIVRLGDIRGFGIEQTEVILRDSNLFSMDYRVLKDQPQFDQNVKSPHGIEPHEACRIWRYAGYSDQMKVAALFEVPEDEKGNNNNYLLGGEMIWHFLDGMCGREQDYPYRSSDEYKMQIVAFEGMEEGLKFFKNINNNRWWMEVPSAQGNVLMACRQEDYKKALKNEFPDKWWRFYLKYRSKDEIT